jgi:hypothetical protein
LRAAQHRQPLDGEGVAVDPEAAQRRLCHRRNVRRVTKIFARKNIADVNLVDRQVDCRDRVAQR